VVDMVVVVATIFFEARGAHHDQGRLSINITQTLVQIPFPGPLFFLSQFSLHFPVLPLAWIYHTIYTIDVHTIYISPINIDIVFFISELMTIIEGQLF
jgi:hypothetical protein